MKRCGFLIPGAEGGIGGLPPKKLSAPVIIEWWHENRERPKNEDESMIFATTINVDVNLPKNHDLVFTLINGSEWTSSVELNHKALPRRSFRWIRRIADNNYMALEVNSTYVLRR